MINPLAPSGPVALAPPKADGVSASAPAPVATPVRQQAARAPSPAADLAAKGPPVDETRIARIRAAIADGSYRANPLAIAAAMVALDLGDGR